jgi:hypothetical protein
MSDLCLQPRFRKYGAVPPLIHKLLLRDAYYRFKFILSKTEVLCEYTIGILCVEIAFLRPVPPYSLLDTYNRRFVATYQPTRRHIQNPVPCIVTTVRSSSPNRLKPCGYCMYRQV